MPPKPGDQPSPGRSPNPNLNLPCPLPPIPSCGGGGGGGAGPPPPPPHHRRARSEVAFRFPDDLGLGGGADGGGFDEIGSEDDLFSTFMDIEKIVGTNCDSAVETSSLPRHTKHHHSAFIGRFVFGLVRVAVGGLRSRRRHQPPVICRRTNHAPPYQQH